MLGSADPEHIDSKKTNVEFHLNSTYVLMIVDISLYAEWKSTEIHALLPA